MNKLKAILVLIRFPNLVFILLTQCLTYFFLILPSVESPTLSLWEFLRLGLSTVLIASAGYMINDYFDMGIDAVNKPQRVTIEKIFRRRTVILGHILLNLIGFLLAAQLAYTHVLLRVSLVQVGSILLLLVYSTTLKRKLIVGNLSIAVLTALTLLSVALYEPAYTFPTTGEAPNSLFWVYLIFAFVITLIREIVKDIEDIKGDAVQHCTTIPLKWGITYVKNILYGLLLFMYGFLALVGLFFFKENPRLILYLIVLVMLPLGYIFYSIRKAATTAEFHQISSHIKWITLLGILSMVLI